MFIGFTASRAACPDSKFSLTWSAYLYDNLSIADRYRFRTDLTIDYMRCSRTSRWACRATTTWTRAPGRQGRVDDYRAGSPSGIPSDPPGCIARTPDAHDGTRIQVSGAISRFGWNRPISGTTNTGT